MTPFREPDLTLMFTVFLLPLMVHASLGNSGALSSAKGRITSNTSQGWGRWLQPRLVAQMKGSQRGLWTIRPLGCGRFIVGPGRGLTPLSPSQGCRDIQSWFCIIWGWFPATCNCSFIMPLKALGGQPFQIFQKNIREQASTKSRKTFPSQVLCQQHRFSPTATVCVCVCVCVCVWIHILLFENATQTTVSMTWKWGGEPAYPYEEGLLTTQLSVVFGFILGTGPRAHHEPVHSQSSGQSQVRLEWGRWLRGG